MNRTPHRPSFRSKLLTAVLLISFLLGTSPIAYLTSGELFPVAQAAINQQINYQGKLTDSSGSQVSNGTYHMTFRLYTSATSATTTNIWEEDRSIETGNRVTVTNGLFSVMLGSSTALTSVDFNQTLYLGVEIGGSSGSPTWDGEMAPRKILGAVPAAFEAQRLGGLNASQFLRADGTTNSTSTSNALVTITQSGSGDAITVTSGLTTLATLAVTSSTTLQNFTGLNSTTTNATTTNFFATTASSTNLFSTIGNIGLLTAGEITSGLINGQAISSAANFTGTLTATAGLVTFGYASTTQISSTDSAYFATGGGSVGIGTTTPGSLFSIGNTNGINFSTGTSTFSSLGGIDLTSGCFAINGSCIGGSGGSSQWTTSGSDI